MKRFMSVLFALSATVIISLVFTGCKGEVEQPAKTEQPSAEQPAKTEHPSGEHPK